MKTKTVLIINQKGGVGKTTIADELTFALERRGFKAVYVSTDPQGGAVHTQPEDYEEIENADYQIVDTAGYLSEGLSEWCENADVILIPMMVSPRDIEPTKRTYEIAQAQASAPVRIVVNGYYPYGVLDRQLVEFLTESNIPVAAKIPRTVAFGRAAGQGVALIDFDAGNPAVTAVELLTDEVMQIA